MKTQITLHKIFRSKIPDWKRLRLIDGAVLTYHLHNPRAPTDSLYVCLNLPSVNLPMNRSRFVSEETQGEIPGEIKSTMKAIASEHLTNPLLDRLETMDYEFELLCNNAQMAYDGAPIEEILRFASKGTETALEILDNPRTRNRTWRTDKEIADSINQSINQRLTSDRERKWGLHFACNSIFLSRGVESRLRRVLNQQIDEGSHGVLDFLYKIERTEEP